MNLTRTGRRLTAVAALLLFLPASLALADSSIKRIHSTNFGIDQGDIEVIKSRMQAAVDGDFLNGALLLVGNSDGVGVLESVGLLSPDNPRPVNRDSIFRIYSMTKPIVSVAIMTMVEDGLIALDDPVSKFIPQFADAQVIDRETGELSPAEHVMTIENLLTHESGLIQAIFSPDSDLGQMYASELSGDFSAQELAARIGQLPLYFEPGTAWHYGHSTDVLGAVLEVAGGKTLDMVLQERIFDPLGMGRHVFLGALAGGLPDRRTDSRRRHDRQHHSAAHAVRRWRPEFHRGELCAFRRDAAERRRISRRAHHRGSHA